MIPLQQLIVTFFALSLVTGVAIHLFGGGGWSDTLNSILPEIFGFFLDGAIFVFLIGYIQQLQAFRQRQRVKRHVLSILSRFSPAMVYWKDEKWHIASRKELEQKSIDVAAEIANFDSDLLKELLPVTATFSSSHLSAWARMMFHLDAVKNGKGPAQEHVEKFYEHANTFLTKEVEK